jgi:hypothetical protein
MSEVCNMRCDSFYYQNGATDNFGNLN